ncbi:MAG: hypothetical protein PWP08_1209 [Methanofollis sp.]|nr:hypothetical protein [Methanofollis sp.]
MTTIRPCYSRDHLSLYHGDSLALTDQIPEGSVDLIFADPPYNLSNGGFTCQNGQRGAVDKGTWDRSAGLNEDFLFHRRWIVACDRLLRDGGTSWISGTYHSIYACGSTGGLSGSKKKRSTSISRSDVSRRSSPGGTDAGPGRPHCF